MSQLSNQIVIYQPDETLRIDVRLENDTVWLTQARMGDLFGVDRTVINRHIRNIYATAELLEEATCAKIAQVQKEGGRMVSRIQPYYNLDVIIAVGYRVNSPQATHFRIWATGVLKEVLLRGYAVNERIDRLERRVAKTEEQIGGGRGSVRAAKGESNGFLGISWWDEPSRRADRAGECEKRLGGDASPHLCRSSLFLRALRGLCAGFPHNGNVFSSLWKPFKADASLGICPLFPPKVPGLLSGSIPFFESNLCP